MPEPILNATISHRIDMGPELMIIHVVPNDWEIPKYKSGQFAILGLPGSAARGGYSFAEKKHPDAQKFIQRAYSISSSPNNLYYLEFYITLVREGALTPRLWCLRMGDRVWLSPKMSGDFTMDNIPEDKNIIFIGTGTGVAPFMSMLKTYLRPGVKRKFALLNGVRQSQDLGFRSEIYSYQAMYDNFKYFPIISRERDDPVPWKGPIGHVQKIWQEGKITDKWGLKPTPENSHIFLCGHPQMIKEMTEILVREGFKAHSKKEPGNIHIEKYW